MDTILNKTKLIKVDDYYVYHINEKIKITKEEHDEFLDNIKGNIKVCEKELGELTEENLNANIKKIRDEVDEQKKIKEKFLKAVDTSKFKREHRTSMLNKLLRKKLEAEKFLEKFEEIAEVAIENLKKDYEKQKKGFEDQLQREKKNLNVYEKVEVKV